MNFTLPNQYQMPPDQGFQRRQALASALQGGNSPVGSAMGGMVDAMKMRQLLRPRTPPMTQPAAPVSEGQWVSPTTPPDMVPYS